MFFAAANAATFTPPHPRKKFLREPAVPLGIWELGAFCASDRSINVSSYAVDQVWLRMQYCPGLLEQQSRIDTHFETRMY